MNAKVGSTLKLSIKIWRLNNVTRPRPVVFIETLIFPCPPLANGHEPPNLAFHRRSQPGNAG